MKNKGVRTSSIIIIIVLLVIHFLVLNIFGTPLSLVSITGKVVTTSVGFIKLGVIEQAKLIRIYSPEARTYNFSKGAAYLIALNVTANFPTDAWEYSLFDVTHNVYVEQNTTFIPNSSISAVRWDNILEVYAHEVDNGWVRRDVQFFVNVPNSAPILMNISDELFVCESENFYFEYNATDIDEESLTTTLSFPNPFFERFISYDNDSTSFFRIISPQLSKSDAGGVGNTSKSYPRTITVYDDENLIDTKDVDITVIEINNQPIIGNELGAQTVWLQGDNSTFFHQYNVNDIEDGNTTDGNFNFNSTFIGIGDIFTIDPTTGVMSYSPDITEVGNIYSIRACVEDNPLPVAHQNFSECSVNGKRATSWVVCDDFSLTITDQNRAPEIINWTPFSTNINANGKSVISFSVEVRDPDGTVPDIDWYIDGVLAEHNENKTNDTYSISFPCGVDGLKSVSIIATDGLLSTVLAWNINLAFVECLVSVGGGGGGGSSIDSDFCREDWACGDFDVCQNVKKSFDIGSISIEDYSLMAGICAQSGFDDERFCGFQVKQCVDINNCTNEVLREEMPIDKQYCFYTEAPNCNDGITNCHDGGCESLKDCGGPCGACATCSDGIQNQREEDVDCGGPCPYQCEEEIPAMRKGLIVFLIIMSIVLTGVLGFFGWKLFLILRERYYSY